MSNNSSSGKGKESFKVDSSNMASNSDVLAHLSSIDLSSEALITMLIIEILEHLSGDANEIA